MAAGPQRTVDTEGLVLRREETGESHTRLVVLSQEHGVLNCLRRRGKGKTAATGASADLFDEAALRLEAPALHTGTWFVKEYRVLRRHEGIGRNYAALRAACAFADVLARNPPPAEFAMELHRLTSQVLGAFETGVRPDCALLKGLYLLARTEGYAAREHWWETLPAADRATAAEVLNTPLPEQTAPPAAVERLLQTFRKWLREETDFVVGD